MYTVFVYYVMFYQFIKMCIIRVVLLWFIINRFMICPLKRKIIVKTALTIRNIWRKKWFWCINKILFATSLYFKLLLFLCIWANSINFSFALHSWLSTCFKAYCKLAAVFLYGIYCHCILCIFFQSLMTSTVTSARIN